MAFPRGGETMADVQVSSPVLADPTQEPASQNSLQKPQFVNRSLWLVRHLLARAGRHSKEGGMNLSGLTASVVLGGMANSPEIPSGYWKDKRSVVFWTVCLCTSVHTTSWLYPHSRVPEEGM